MKRQWMVWLMIFTCSGFLYGFTPPVISYTLRAEQGRLHIAVEYPNTESRPMKFIYGDVYYGGMKDLMRGFHMVSCSVPFEIDSLESALICLPKSAQTIKIEYYITDTHLAEQKVRGEMFRPILTKDYLFSLSHSLFIRPENLDKNEGRMASFKLAPSQVMPIFCSFAPSLQKGGRVDLPYKIMMDALIMGAVDLHVEEKIMCGIANYLVLRVPSADHYNFKRFDGYIEAFMPSMEAFWGSFPGEFYSLIAAPFVDIAYHDVSGTAFYNGFHIKYSGDTVLANGTVVNVVSHEIMHRFIGAGSVSMGEVHQWFDEGFTDFTTWLILKNAGLIDEKRFFALIRETHKNLQNNPANHISNGEIQDHFWDNHDYEKLPYQRGALFAAYLYKKMGQENYQSLMRSLRKNTESKQSNLLPEEFIILCQSLLPKVNVDKAYKKYILGGKVIKQRMFLR